LRLSQAEFGKLLAQPLNSVYLWKRKERALNLRDKTKGALLSIRGLGAKEARTRLDGSCRKSKRNRGSCTQEEKVIMKPGLLFHGQ